MKKNSRESEWKERPERTVGVDLGDRFSHYCVLKRDGEVIEEGRIRTNEEAFRRHWEGEPRQRIVMETGTHSPWIYRLLKGLGHQVIVANARKVRAIWENESKNDRQDAEMLAQLGYSNPRLLSPIQHRSVERQRDLNLLRARDALVRARTMLINSVRGLVKSAGGRLPKCAADYFATKVSPAVPVELVTATRPLVDQITALTVQIRGLDQEIENLAKRYPEIPILRTAPGVGPVVAAAYVLTLDRVDAVAHSRSIGAFLGLRPKQSQSGESDPEHKISKTGNIYLRRLLVQAAHYILGRFGPDSALRRWGLKLAQGGKRAKKRAVVAVARKLAVILHRMWRTGQDYQPFPERTTEAVEVA
ncbi:MAG TPA: IS110 family transposase [Candidatus Angelobacter sp.]|nr:IS110 family transposase [Candidatus Angelobacter sp.]